jgi:hypothetical protein
MDDVFSVIADDRRAAALAAISSVAGQATVTGISPTTPARRAPRRSGSTLARTPTCCGSNAAGWASETRSAATRVFALQQLPPSRRPCTMPTKRRASC